MVDKMRSQINKIIWMIEEIVGWSVMKIGEEEVWKGLIII